MELYALREDDKWACHFTYELHSSLQRIVYYAASYIHCQNGLDGCGWRETTCGAAQLYLLIDHLCLGQYELS
jgi:hypothetical protein